MDLRITSSTVGDLHVVALDGTADLAGAPALHSALAHPTAAGASGLVVDLDGLTVLDDVALGLLLGAAARARAAGGELLIVCSPGRIRDRLAHTRLDRVIPVRPTITAVRTVPCPDPLAPDPLAADRWTRSGSSAIS